MMVLLVVGLALFLGIHAVPVFTGLRSRLFVRLGERKYKGVFSAVSAVGLILIIVGYSRAPADIRWFTPLPAAIAAAPAAMLVSFVLLAAANMRTHIRARIRHPMLIGVGLWALVHLLANGEARATILFASFLVYCVVDLASAIRRRAVKTFVPEGRYDAMAVTGGIVVALLVMLFHGTIFGVPAVQWSI
jgi:uncharacterized membrane protein